MAHNEVPGMPVANQAPCQGLWNVDAAGSPDLSASRLSRWVRSQPMRPGGAGCSLAGRRQHSVPSPDISSLPLATCQCDKPCRPARLVLPQTGLAVASDLWEVAPGLLIPPLLARW